MTEEACVHEKLGFASNSSWYEKHRSSTAARLQWNEVSVRAIALLGLSCNVPRELLYRGRFHQHSGHENDPEFSLNCGTHLDGGEGISS
jgi:hypothetical protein